MPIFGQGYPTSNENIIGTESNDDSQMKNLKPIEWEGDCDSHHIAETENNGDAEVTIEENGELIADSESNNTIENNEKDQSENALHAGPLLKVAQDVIVCPQ